MPHGHKVTGKHAKPTIRNNMKADAEMAQARLRGGIPGARVEVGLIDVKGREDRGFIFLVPTKADKARAEAGLKPNAVDADLAKVRPIIGGRPYRVDVIQHA